MSLTNIRVSVTSKEKSIKDIYNKVRHQLRKHDRTDLKNRLMEEWQNLNNEDDKIKKLKEYVRLHIEDKG